MSKKNDFILKALNVASWIVFIGLCIDAGAIIFNFIFTLIKPIGSHNIYMGLNLSELYQNQFAHFIGVMSFVIVLSLLKAYLFFLVVKIFMKLNFVNPFTAEIAKLIKEISYEALSIAIIGYIAHHYTKRLIQSGYEVGNAETYWNDTTAFLMMAGIIFVISQIFNKGIELQRENDLTV
jgi:hypothetical protein